MTTKRPNSAASNPAEEMRCWFCRKDRLGSKEHIIPQALGGTLLTWRVCKDCNSTLGRFADSPIGNHLLVQIWRAKLSLAGYGGAIPEPLRVLLKDARLAADPYRPVRLEFDKAGRPRPRLIFQEVVTESADGTKLDINIDAGEADRLPEILNRRLKQRGLKTMTDAEASDLVERAKAFARPLEDSTMAGSVTLETDPTRPGLIKIAYEIACKVLGDVYLDDPQAVRLSEAALGQRTLVGWIWGASTMSVPAHLRKIGGPGCKHSLLLARAGNAIYALVFLFDALTAQIIISKDADNYVPRNWPGWFFQIDASTGQQRMSSLALEEWRLHNLERQGKLRQSTALAGLPQPISPF